MFSGTKFCFPCSEFIKLDFAPLEKKINDDLAIPTSHNFTWLDLAKCLFFLCWFTEILQEVSMKVGIHLKKIQLYSRN